MPPKTYEFKLVDAFATSPYSGNVAGVILDADGLTDAQMQLIAREFNAPETTFCLSPTTPQAAIRFRWFTPGCEVNFCGHATLGAVHALLESGRFVDAFKEPGTALTIETRSGVLYIRTEVQPAATPPVTYWLDMPHSEPKSKNVPTPAIADRLGISMNDLDPRLPPIRTQDDDWMLAVRDLQTLLNLAPSMPELARFCRSESIRGVFVTTTNVLSPVTVVQSRFFAPAAGIDEDPVTGSAHGPLGLHLVNCGIVPLSHGKADFLCAQGRAGGRAGIVRVVVSESSSGRHDVRIGGTCITTCAGHLSAVPVNR